MTLLRRRREDRRWTVVDVCGPHLQASAVEEVDQASAVCKEKTMLENLRSDQSMSAPRRGRADLFRSAVFEKTNSLRGKTSVRGLRGADISDQEALLAKNKHHPSSVWKMAAEHTNLETSQVFLESGLNFNNALHFDDCPLRAIRFAAATLQFNFHVSFAARCELENDDFRKLKTFKYSQSLPLSQLQLTQQARLQLTQQARLQWTQWVQLLSELTQLVEKLLGF
ncbi:hypothetical protein LXL04_021667 [Taraxacum kok-saghyz]